MDAMQDRSEEMEKDPAKKKVMVTILITVIVGAGLMFMAFW